MHLSREEEPAPVLDASLADPQADPLSPRQRFFSLAAVIWAMAMVTFIIGLTFPFLALLLERQGVSTAMIGYSTAVQGMAILFIAPFAPRLIAFMGPNWSMAVGMGGSAFILALLPLWPDVWVWFPLRFALGAVSSLLWIASEAWINSVAREETRGRVVSIYSIAGAAGFTMGPAMLTLIGTETNLPFLIAVTALALPCLPLLLAPTAGIAFEKTQKGGWGRVLALAPAPILITFIFAGSEEALHTFFAIFTMELGEGETLALRLIAALGFGGIVLGYPIGWLADHVNRLNLLILLTLTIFAAILAVPQIFNIYPLNYIYFLVLGGIMGGTYTVGMTLLGERFEGADLVTASTMTTTFWGVGAVAGPSLAGQSMGVIGPNGLIFAICFVILLYLPFPFWERWRLLRRSART
jgi:MFS family permease